MRMWKVNPKNMCRQHLLGEHVECHMFVGAILKGISLSGYIKKGLVEIHNIKSRHQELVNEMIARKYNHNSPLPEFESFESGCIDSEKNLQILNEKCIHCREMQK